jgi:hypothetical protein
MRSRGHLFGGPPGYDNLQDGTFCLATLESRNDNIAQSRTVVSSILTPTNTVDMSVPISLR